MVDLDQRSATTAATRIVTLAWLLTAVFYFYQYSMRSAPAVMMPDLTAAFGLGAVVVMGGCASSRGGTIPYNVQDFGVPDNLHDVAGWAEPPPGCSRHTTPHSGIR